MLDNNDALLRVSDLKTSFRSDDGRVQAVSGVSLSVSSGQTLGIVGESGCGKSVTAHSIISLLPKNGRVDSGEIIYRLKDGSRQDLAKLKPDGKLMRRIRGSEIGMVFQDPMASLNPVYTIGDQITEKLIFNEKLSKAEAVERAADMLHNLNFASPRERMRDYPHQLSGGMKQRVIIAMAMITNPSLLIADEPTTALDVTIQAQILELMSKIQQERNNAIILITHNMGILAKMAQAVAVMYMGKVVEYGGISDIFKQSAHPYTKALLRCVPVLGQSNKRLYTIEGNTPDPKDLRDGCSFADRCDKAEEVCFSREPDTADLGGGHMVRCHLCGRGDV